MYTPKHFVEPRVEALHGLIRAYPFATLVTHAADGLTANHLPFERVGEVLRSRLALIQPESSD